MAATLVAYKLHGPQLLLKMLFNYMFNQCYFITCKLNLFQSCSQKERPVRKTTSFGEKRVCELIGRKKKTGWPAEEIWVWVNHGITLITNWSLFNMKHPNLVVIIFVSFDQSPSEASLRWHQNAPLPPANTVRLRIHDDPVTSLHQRWNDAGHSGDTRRIPLTLTCSYGDHTLLGMQWAQYIYIL